MRAVPASHVAYMQHVVRTFSAGAKPLPFKRFVRMVWAIAQGNVEASRR